jgi:hypothetical protein
MTVKKLELLQGRFDPNGSNIVHFNHPLTGAQLRMSSSQAHALFEAIIRGRKIHQG